MLIWDRAALLLQRQKNVLQMIESGFPAKDAAKSIGVSRGAIHRWRTEDGIFDKRWKAAREIGVSKKQK